MDSPEKCGHVSWPLLLLLFEPHGLQSERAGDEGDVRSLFNESTDPPVIIVLLSKVNSRIGSHLSDLLWPYGGVGHHRRTAWHATTHFFDVQEVFGIEIDCSSLDGTVLIQSSAVAHIRLDCKRYWFGLEDKSTSEFCIYFTAWDFHKRYNCHVWLFGTTDIEVRLEKKWQKAPGCQHVTCCYRGQSLDGDRVALTSPVRTSSHLFIQSLYEVKE